MAKTTKLSASQKIINNLVTLKQVSEDRSGIEDVAALTDNEIVKAFILKQENRYAADIDYLRKRIVYQAQKVATEMTVEKFETFATGLAKLIS